MKSLLNAITIPIVVGLAMGVYIAPLTWLFGGWGFLFGIITAGPALGWAASKLKL